MALVRRSERGIHLLSPQEEEEKEQQQHAEDSSFGPVPMEKFWRKLSTRGTARKGSSSAAARPLLARSISAPSITVPSSVSGCSCDAPPAAGEEAPRMRRKSSLWSRLQQMDREEEPSPRPPPDGSALLTRKLSNMAMQHHGRKRSVGVPGRKLQRTSPLRRCPLVVHQKLANGFSYYIRPNPSPPKVLCLQLVVPIGSIHEEEHERGLAHFVEHLCFNGSKNFKRGEIFDFTAAIGSTLGADTNALTHYDKTEYSLTVPLTNFEANPEVAWQIINRACLVLADIAGDALCEDESIETERYIVQEEQRLSSTSASRDAMAMHHAILEGTKYADRDPIGTEAVVMRAEAAVIRGFYKKHYKREKMALFVAGDIPHVEAMEALIRAHFGDGRGLADGIPAPTAVPQSAKAPAPPLVSRKASVEEVLGKKKFKRLYTNVRNTDSPGTSVSIFLRQHRRKWRRSSASSTQTGTVSDDIEQMAGFLLHAALQERLRVALESQGLSAVWEVTCGIEQLTAQYQTLQLSLTHTSASVLKAEANAPNQLVLTAMRLLMENVELARRFGIHEEELVAARVPMQYVFDRMASKISNFASTERLQWMQEHFEFGAEMVGDEDTVEISQWILGETNEHDVNAEIGKWADGGDVICFIQKPRSSGAEDCTEEDLRQLWDEVLHSTMVKPSFKEAAKAELMLPSLEHTPAGAILNKELVCKQMEQLTNASFRQSMVLSNGMKVDIQCAADRVLDLSSPDAATSGMWGMEVTVSSSLSSCTGLLDITARDPTLLAAGSLSTSLAACCGYGLGNAASLERFQMQRMVGITSHSVDLLASTITLISPADHDSIGLALAMVRAIFTQACDWQNEYHQELCKNILHACADAQEHAERHSTEAQFEEEVLRAAFGNGDLLRSCSAEEIRAVDAETAVGLFDDAFSDPTDAEVVITLSTPLADEASVAHLLTMIEKWLSSIACKDTAKLGRCLKWHEEVQRKKEQTKDAMQQQPSDSAYMPVSLERLAAVSECLDFAPTGAQRRCVCWTEEHQKATVRICFPLPVSLSNTSEAEPVHCLNWMDDLLLSLVCTILNRLLFKEMRTNLGAVYTVSCHKIYPFSSTIQKGLTAVTFVCDPSAVNSLVRVVFRTIRRLQSEPLSSQDVLTAVSQQDFQYQTHLVSGAFDKDGTIKLQQDFMNKLWSIDWCSVIRTHMPLHHSLVCLMLPMAKDAALSWGGDNKVQRLIKRETSPQNEDDAAALALEHCHLLAECAHQNFSRMRGKLLTQDIEAMLSAAQLLDSALTNARKGDAPARELAQLSSDQSAALCFCLIAKEQQEKDAGGQQENQKKEKPLQQNQSKLPPWLTWERLAEVCDDRALDLGESNQAHDLGFGFARFRHALAMKKVQAQGKEVELTALLEALDSIDLGNGADEASAQQVRETLRAQANESAGSNGKHRTTVDWLFSLCSLDGVADKQVARVQVMQELIKELEFSLLRLLQQQRLVVGNTIDTIGLQVALRVEKDRLLDKLCRQRGLSKAAFELEEQEENDHENREGKARVENSVGSGGSSGSSTGSSTGSRNSSSHGSFSVLLTHKATIERMLSDPAKFFDSRNISERFPSTLMPAVALMLYKQMRESEGAGGRGRERGSERERGGGSKMMTAQGKEAVSDGNKPMGLADTTLDEQLTRLTHRFQKISWSGWASVCASILALAHGLGLGVQPDLWAATLFCVLMTTVLLIKKIQPGGWIDPALYPELQVLVNNRQVIVEEVEHIMEEGIWCRWGSYDTVKTPMFTCMTKQAIRRRLVHYGTSLGKTKSWKLFGLVLFGEPLDDNCASCPKTTALVSQIPGVINAGFSCLEPHSTTGEHQDYNKSFFRCHIPLIVPVGDCKLEVEGVSRPWRMDEVLVFDDTRRHNAWNKTEHARVVLIVDLPRRGAGAGGSRSESRRPQSQREAMPPSTALT